MGKRYQMSNKDIKNILAPSAVRLNAFAGNKEEAITAVGELLAGCGYVKEEYIAEMLKREEMVTTYIGNGVAIPHGTEESRKMVNKTGLSLVQFPEGIDFGGETAYILIGIAANDDSHLEILAKLADVVGNIATVDKLIHADSYEEIFKLLTEPDSL